MRAWFLRLSGLLWFLGLFWLFRLFRLLGFLGLLGLLWLLGLFGLLRLLRPFVHLDRVDQPIRFSECLWVLCNEAVARRVDAADVVALPGVLGKVVTAEVDVEDLAQS